MLGNITAQHLLSWVYTRRSYAIKSHFQSMCQHMQFKIMFIPASFSTDSAVMSEHPVMNHAKVSIKSTDLTKWLVTKATHSTFHLPCQPALSLGFHRKTARKI